MRIGRANWVLLIIVFVAVALLWLGPNEQIRTDCGDVRSRFWGVTLESIEMPEPQRTALLSIGGSDSVWITMPHGRRSASESLLIQSMYKDAVNWQKVNNVFFQIVVRDIANHIKIHGGNAARIPIDKDFLFPFEMFWNSRENKPNIDSASSLKEYCRRHNYTPAWDQ